jgi:uncharacterized protein (TIGR02453 family)
MTALDPDEHSRRLAAESAFGGFGAGAVAWFQGLERDNTREYFKATRATFDAEVRGPFELLLAELSDEFGGEVSVFRQHRDVRFSADKSPYKTRTYGLLHRAGEGNALYAEISARGIYAAAGYWRMGSDQLGRFREAVLADGPGAALGEAMRAVQDAGLELAPPALKTAPRGMARDHPRVALLRYKDLIAGRRLAPGSALATREALEHVAATWRSARPLTAWLDEHVGAGEHTQRS